MSRGPGRWQRQILRMVAEHPEGVVLTSPGQSAAEQNAIRRAAGQLVASGAIQTAPARLQGESRLMAFPAAAALPPFRVVRGLDGKEYRYPA